MDGSGVKRHLAAVVIVDIVGYSRLVSAAEAETISAVNRRWEVLKPLVSANGGRVIKFLGDGALMEFSSAVDAVRVSLMLQQRMSEANDTTDAPPIAEDRYQSWRCDS